MSLNLPTNVTRPECDRDSMSAKPGMGRGQTHKLTRMLIDTFDWRQILSDSLCDESLEVSTCECCYTT